MKKIILLAILYASSIVSSSQKVDSSFFESTLSQCKTFYENHKNISHAAAWTGIGALSMYLLVNEHKNHLSLRNECAQETSIINKEWTNFTYAESLHVNDFKSTMRILAGSKMFLEFIEDEKEFFINNNLGSTKEEFLLIENIDETTWNLLKNEYGAYLIQKQTELEFIEKDYTSSYSTTFKNTIAALGITSAFFGLLISVLPPEQNRSYYYSKPDKINCYY